ncbi:hypothetical protein RB2501_05375 [Robiginitalea biformata HTCC2501]|uniref:Uncharacterized protein n=1 Tax=Robiginitalea biformata (strain ATCC BAA-864 / DSM 15991 / KCTC 12146 / HTCC2501) TaxID=313596 RepID=A4CH95_ROBBH|nr:hypothetical protein RB2501_05375 [Robiginitalea biformata HTCC2501]
MGFGKGEGTVQGPLGMAFIMDDYRMVLELS